MRARATPIRWVRDYGYRLDAQPYLSGAIETRARLDRLALRKDPLQTLTKGHLGGIYRPFVFISKQVWVDDPAYGVPFLTGSSMVRMDLSELPLLSRKQAESRTFRVLQVHEGTTLVSCSGTIGRTAYVGPEMDGMWTSLDLMKIVPDEKKVDPGYLFAFLSSRFGIPLVSSGTYGAVIRHIDREHLIDLPVPRFTRRVEAEIHERIVAAAKKRFEASTKLRAANRDIQNETATQLELASNHSSVVSCLALRRRMDAFYYHPQRLAAVKAIERSRCAVRPLASIADVSIPGIFKRLYADDPAWGIPYLSGTEVFSASPSSNRFLMKRVATDNSLIVEKGVILVQEAGGSGGSLGRPVIVGEALSGFACTNNMFRIRCTEDLDAGYLFAFLASPCGRKLVEREAAGSLVQHTDLSRIREVPVPWASTDVRKRIGLAVIDATKLRDDAVRLEREAIRLLERGIEEAN
jgi:type I restriction enzyme S subunit